MESFCREHGLVFENPDDFMDPVIDYQMDKRIPSKLAKKLAELNYRKAKPIQSVAIPIILDKRDFVGMKNFFHCFFSNFVIIIRI